MNQQVDLFGGLGVVRRYSLTVDGAEVPPRDSPKFVDDRLAEIVDRLERTLLGEAAPSARAAPIAAMSGGLPPSTAVESSGARLSPPDVYLTLTFGYSSVEPVDHGLERLLLLATPDRHDRDVAA